MELELQHRRQEVARVRRHVRDVELRARVEELLAAWRRGYHTLILQPQRPPGRVVALGWDLAGKHLPAPLIDHQAEREERDLLKCFREEQADVTRRVRRFGEQPDL